MQGAGSSSLYTRELFVAGIWKVGRKVTKGIDKAERMCYNR